MRRFQASSRLIVRLLQLCRAVFFAEPLARPAFFVDEVEAPIVTPRGIALPTAILSGSFEQATTKMDVCVDLFLPEESALQRTLQLPPAVEHRLDEVIKLDLIRSTPFVLGEIYTTRSKPIIENCELTVEQWIVKTATIDAVVDRLGAIGLAVKQVRLHHPLAKVPFVDLTGRLAPNQRRWQLTNIALFAGALLMLLYVWLVPSLETSNRLVSIQAENAGLLARAVDEMQALEMLESEAGEQRALTAFLFDRRRLMEALSDLTEAMPDSVWVSDLTFTPERLVLAGNTSGSAASVVLLLSEITVFADPRISGPVTRTATGEERFELTIDLLEPPS
ncbi:PilN domain-containing protein [Fontisubflavum oceani]|uniref:PilN domain-containing protein n=1 Tax=Fontisubflavum oceani TaxID=2978973 RepID=UPI0025B34289|nr:PilN domain-containing protein [Fontisubflavum oceani]WJY20384.1 PilN domain-containing protein [Fontisubflavum oceani]